MTTAASPVQWQVIKRQVAAIGLFLSLFVVVSLVLYWKDRQQEWRFRVEQASHQLELTCQLILRDIERVRSDINFMANLGVVREFERDDIECRSVVESEFASFLHSKKTFQQMRLLDFSGRERVRVDWRAGKTHVVAESELQNKEDRYYFREGLQLREGEIFVSEFDLNQEHGKIEHPLSPVIRFITPASNPGGEPEFLLVGNYLGAPLLEELSSTSLPGRIFLIRDDGQYLLGPTAADAWGWLLGHPNSFDRQFARAWSQRAEYKSECFLTSKGAFAFREIQFGGEGPTLNKKTLLAVSYLPSGKVFATSRQLLNRLGVIFGIVVLPLIMFARFWAWSSVRRKEQNRLIQESERKLRELSARLVRIQEEERKSISREIHDQLGQQATAINLDLKLAAQELASEKTCEQLQRAIQESEQLLEALHEFATRVRPVELDDLGLHDAIESFLKDFRTRTLVDVRLESNIQDKKLSTGISENVFRLVQESLNNVLKHANATRVEIRIQRIEIDGVARIEIRIEDNGTGTDESCDLDSVSQKAGSESRLGILGMQERVDLMGGTFNWESEIGRGTIVDVVVPISHPNGDL